ncbi:hypothetical protein H6802_02635 [Candidatus Nomurabacteria bacterium]|uniref:Uncharacterized protein n=1 Tax=candidate division WWE3 bacterium TaxID=2053526 RepID=A0A955DZR1_UNCKA|nr:hypothetical protein [candidate division WWE3 bacterium]MCB9823831.1 hypothetical protein [Candidatus Nomurabacteria bacterium]MCB9826763.1 hypothetical protein [Candidatus Nomurabacteria bacterium]MCB9827626.1 hypothetical protein [Candidatus Nomurabacteria bacterium]HXK52478.1 hypothetical protein [bacterium]
MDLNAAQNTNNQQLNSHPDDAQKNKLNTILPGTNSQSLGGNSPITSIAGVSDDDLQNKSINLDTQDTLSTENKTNTNKEIEKAKGYKDDISKIVYDFLEKNGESLDSMEEVPSDIGPSINNHPATLGPGKGRREIFTSPVIGTISENAPISHRETFQTEIDPASQTEQISVAKAETSAQEEKNSSEIQSIQEVLQNPQPDSENYDKISTLIPETEPIPQPDSDLNVVDLRTGHENLQQIADPIDKLTEEADEKEADFITKVEDTHAVAN